MNYYPLHVGDWVLHTNHLSPEEEGVYLRILNHYYDTEAPIPEKTDSVIRRLRLGNQTEIFHQILAEFFVLQADGWHNLRADIEISTYNEKAERARENGKKGGRPKKLRHQKTQPVISGNPEETGSKANQEPRTNNQEPKEKSDRSGDQSLPPELVQKGFEFFWKTWKDAKKACGKLDTSPKQQTFAKKWKPYFRTTKTPEEFRAKVNRICEFVVEAHSIEGFNRFENMQTGKFFTEKQWEDQ